MERESWLWKNFWSQHKEARNARLEFRELIEKLDEDYLGLYIESKRKGEEIFGWSGLSREELAWIRSDIELLGGKIKDLFSHSHIREESKEAWGVDWSQKVWRVLDYLHILQREVNREMLLLHDSEEDLKFIIERDWSLRRKEEARRKLQLLRA